MPRVQATSPAGQEWFEDKISYVFYPALGLMFSSYYHEIKWQEMIGWWLLFVYLGSSVVRHPPFPLPVTEPWSLTLRASLSHAIPGFSSSPPFRNASRRSAYSGTPLV